MSVMDLALPPLAALPPAGAHVREALLGAREWHTPFRHWLVQTVLPHDIARAMAALPFDAPVIDDTLGKRETHNATRIFVTPANRCRYPACSVLAEAWQNEATIALLQDLCEVDLAGAFLRIECTFDQDGFWLEPHTDIGAKLFTMVIYLSEHPDASNWGTDFMDATGALIGRASGAFNTGLVFVPAADTWHGFARRRIAGVRRSLIINYVKPEWRSRHELAYPDQPIVAMA